MAIKRMNHAVLYVRDAQRSADFYRDVLGFPADQLDPDQQLGTFPLDLGATIERYGAQTVGGR